MIDSYTRQTIYAEWSGQLSHKFSAKNGTKQGSINSPGFFSIYLDVLLQTLHDSGLGCYVGSRYAGSFGYADDAILLSPTVSGLQKMINICERFGIDYHVSFNSSKTYCIKFSNNSKTSECNKSVYMNGEKLQWKKTIKHLGNLMNWNLCDGEDIEYKRGQFTGSVNKLVSKFPKCNRINNTKVLKSMYNMIY